MGLFSRKEKKVPRRQQKEAEAATRAHMAEFAASRIGVEAYFEPATPREQAALLLVANDGEWTRRRVPDLASAADVAQEIGLPFYEVVKTGYPAAMRRYNEKKRSQ
ncbi:MAG: oxidoreductase [Actinomycetaceae bacterium]|nr:oxidoreductase [Actinomycetaceae bacterium]